MRTIKVLIGASALIVAGCQARGEAPSMTSSALDVPHMREFRVTSAPAGYDDFCRRAPRECATGRSRSGRVVMNRQRWAELNAVNSRINRAVRPTTDQQLYGMPEYWAFPGRYGDCEDYVLLKRKRLIERGWPAAALLITVLRDENNDGHAVLTVVTNKGDLVLDNKVDAIRPWSETPYTYYLRQSRSDPSKWVTLSPGELGTRPLATVARRQEIFGEVEPTPH
jgi:predicted transglutaminase-like cysteine proteinase